MIAMNERHERRSQKSLQKKGGGVGSRMFVCLPCKGQGRKRGSGSYNTALAWNARAPAARGGHSMQTFVPSAERTLFSNSREREREGGGKHSGFRGRFNPARRRGERHPEVTSSTFSPEKGTRRGGGGHPTKLSYIIRR